MKRLLIGCMLLWQTVAATAQTDSLHTVELPRRTVGYYCTRLILPVGLITVGALGLGHNRIKRWEVDLQQHMTGQRPFRADDYMQYVPTVAVYGLNWCGVKGRHNFRDRTMILATSCLIMGVSVTVLKKTTGEWRPDGSACNSFPSGHTATAFMGAEFLRSEHGDISPWIGVVGYAVAAGTGFLRMYNNRHYLTDVLAGAGIGILSTRVAYWIYPPIQRALFGRRAHKSMAMTMPFYDQTCRAVGVGCALQF